MGCCLIALVGAFWPRVALILIWLFAPSIPRAAFTTTLWPLLGFFFLPTTTLAYELVKVYVGAIDSPLGLAILALAFLHDLGQLGLFRRRSTVMVRRAPPRDQFVDPG